MYCTKCGKEAADTDRVCTKCSSKTFTNIRPRGKSIEEESNDTLTGAWRKNIHLD